MPERRTRTVVENVNAAKASATADAGPDGTRPRRAHTRSSWTLLSPFRSTPIDAGKRSGVWAARGAWSGGSLRAMGARSGIGGA